jgi:hypothetical protein
VTVISRDTTATRLRMDIDARHTNAWCRIAGNLFAGELVLLPNHPGNEAVVVAYGPLDLPDVSRLTLLFGAGARPRHTNTLAINVAVVDAGGAGLAAASLNLRQSERGAVTLAYEPPPAGIRVSLAISFADFRDAAAYGTVRLRYALAYATNPFVALCNAAGTDKGTESVTGDGVPHCYALEYFRLFEASREEAFSLLEIGLDKHHPPLDAPSLRAWREFSPNADLYGFDVNDFAFFQQERTHTFCGDQSSHDDLQRFLDESDRPKFRIVVDDGSHASSHQQISLATLFGHVEPGGVYVIEDLGWQPFPESPTTRHVLSAFVERGTIDSPFIGNAEARYLEQAIDHVEIRRPNDSEIAFVYKKREA